MKGMKSVPTGHKRTSQTNNFLTFARNSVKEQMIDRTVFENKKAAYYTLGCKLNFAETSAIGKTLAEAGVRRVRPSEKADICVINTCSVTELADKKCRQAIRRLSKQHPGAFVVVTS